MTGVKTRGELSLINVHATGPIKIRDCHVGHDIDLGAHGPDPRDPKSQTKTRCTTLELEATVCEGDTDLSGPRALAGVEQAGDVLARRLRVGGKLVFSRPLGPDRDAFENLPETPEKRTEAVIHGRLDLAAAEASHLVIAGDSFTNDSPEQGISFERGTFRRFQVVYPFPACHDSSDISVERWEIPDRHFEEYLLKSKPLRRSTYLGVERVLRNDGHDVLADRIYRALRKRVIDDATLETEIPPHELEPKPDDPITKKPENPVRPGLFRKLAFYSMREGSRFLGWSIGWGTRSLRPLALALVFLPISIWVFTPAENIIPTTALLEVTDDLDPNATPTDYGLEWGLSDAAWMALRFQIPVIPVFARDRWEPALDGLRLSLPFTDAWIEFDTLTPEDYAYFIFLIHWVIWPLFLIGVTTKVIRERRVSLGESGRERGPGGDMGKYYDS